MKKKQKFKRGDYLRVEREGKNKMNAIVLGSYADEFGGDNIDDYSLYIEGWSESAWYDVDELTLIEKNRMDLLDKWEKEEKSEDEQKSDIDWIFENRKEVLENPHNATIERLGRDLGSMNLWGSRGEGIVYNRNARFVLKISEAFLKANKKNKWLEFCKWFREHNDNKPDSK